MRLLGNYWTKEKCQEETLKYKSPNELKKNNNYVYVKCFKNKWLEDFYPNFEIKRDIFWTKERCQEEALKYKTRKEFSNNSRSSYTISQRNKWLDDICLHMTKKPSSYWTKERCQEEALKYKTRTEFKNKSYQAYKYSRINCWFDDICNHMPIIGNMYKRCIYSFEFEDNYVYIGLTYNINQRSEAHYTNLSSQVNKHIKNTKLQPKLIKLTNYIDVELAKVKEAEFIELYRNKKWNILNIQNAGNVGGNNRKITEDKCREVVEKYTSLSLFRNENKNIYKNISRYNWKHLLDGLSRDTKPSGYWTKEKCQEISLKYNNRNDFCINDSVPYHKARVEGWLDEICSHMCGILYKKRGYWDKERCLEESKKYKTKMEFKKSSSTAYIKCAKNGWFNETNLTGNKKWNKEECLEIIKKCSNKKEVRNISEKVYRILISNKWNIKNDIVWI
jgi:predicted GIY-YIG superfamily endonuclease